MDLPHTNQCKTPFDICCGRALSSYSLALSASHNWLGFLNSAFFDTLLSTVEQRICQIMIQRPVGNFSIQLCLCIQTGCCLAVKLCPTLATSCTVGHQAPLSMGFPRQEYWSGLPFPSPGGLSAQESNPCLLHPLYCRWILYH